MDHHTRETLARLVGHYAALAAECDRDEQTDYVRATAAAYRRVCRAIRRDFPELDDDRTSCLVPGGPVRLAG
jgi:hypothetical protein